MTTKKNRTNGEILKSYRNFLGIKQKEFAAELGITATYLGYLEQGKRIISDSIFEKLSQHLQPRIINTMKENAKFERMDREELIEELKKSQKEIKKMREQFSKYDKRCGNLTPDELIEIQKMIDETELYFDTYNTKEEDQSKLLRVLTGLYFKSKGK